MPPGGVTVTDAAVLTDGVEAEVGVTSNPEEATAAAAPYKEAVGSWVNCENCPPYWQTWASDENPDKSLICEAEWIKEAAAAADADTAETAESELRAEAALGVVLKSALILISHHYIGLSNNLFDYGKHKRLWNFSHYWVRQDVIGSGGNGATSRVVGREAGPRGYE